MRTVHARQLDGRRGRIVAALVRVARLRAVPGPDFEPVGHEGIRLVAADSVVVSTLYWYGAGAYEGSEPQWWQRACRLATTVVELGANIGYYTVLGATANPGGRYVAVEPHPASADVLRRNLARNDLVNVEVIEAAAVGDRRRYAELAVPARDPHDTPAGSFLAEGAEGVDHVHVDERLGVAAVAAIDLVADADLLKLDIEGQEAAVLDAIRPVLVARQPTLFVEIRRSAVPRLRRILVELIDAGYDARLIGADGLHPLPPDVLALASTVPRLGSKDVLLASPHALMRLEAAAP